MNPSRESTGSHNNSDSDDWTLVSNPNSPPSSPERKENSQDNLTQQSLEQTSSIEIIHDDGLTEIDLGKASTTRSMAILKPVYELRVIEDRASSAEPAMSGFQALDSTTDDDGAMSSSSSVSSSRQSSRRSSLTRSELSDYVDLGKPMRKSTETRLKTTRGKSSRLAVEDAEATEDDDYPAMESIRNRMDELSNATSEMQFNRDCQRLSELLRISVGHLLRNWFFIYIGIVIFYLALIAVFPQLDEPESSKRMDQTIYPEVLKFNGNGIPSSQQYIELQQLHNELSQCIKRQSPTSFKYYLSESRPGEMASKQKSNSGKKSNVQSYRGLVCYGQELQWRKRFDRLRSKHNLDVRKMLLDARKQITAEMLESYHPTLKFKLILNQLEYLDFLEEKREKKQNEETIKYLKAENMQLMRRLNQPNETGYQKLAVKLELANNKLQRENEALRASLLEKAGPTYIKQSLELEQYERENSILKRFHYQVAQDVSKSLKQFNLHTIDAFTILDDQESLNSQLSLTRSYLKRLSEKISTILIENESLKVELKEAYLAAPYDGGKVNLQAMNYAGNPYDNNNSNALMTNTCIRDLYEARERSDRLASEVEQLRRDCNKKQSVELERCSDRDLNRTGEWDLGKSGDKSSPLFLLTNNPVAAVLGKHTKDQGSSLASRGLAGDNQDIEDAMMAFLTKFNERFEESGHNNQLAPLRMDDKLEMVNENIARITGPEANVRILPNYIREAIRERSQQKVNQGSCGSLIRDTTNQLRQQPTIPASSDFCSLQQKPIALGSAPLKPSTLAHRMQNSTLGQRERDNRLQKKTNGTTKDGWFFRRADQRKQLRRREDPAVYNPANWAMRRAELRDKLRKASSYIDGPGYKRDSCQEKGRNKPAKQTSSKHPHSSKSHKKQHRKHNKQRTNLWSSPRRDEL